MAEFTHLTAAQTSPALGWLTMFATKTNWTLLELAGDHFTAGGTAQSGLAGWSVTALAATRFSSGSNGLPVGSIAGFDVRDPSGTLVVTVRGLSALSADVETLRVSPMELFRGDDLFTGSAGDDVFWGGQGSDTVSGGAGNDVLLVGRGVVDGGDGYDTLGSAGPVNRFDAGVVLANIEAVTGANFNVASMTTGVAITGSNGTQIVTADFQVANVGDTANDFIVGGSGADTISTGWGNDTIFPGLGDDYIDAGSPYVGDTIYMFDRSADTLDLSNLNRGVAVNLSLTTAQNTGAGAKTLLGFEVLRGTDFNDTLSGSALTLTGGSGVTNSVGRSTSIYGGAGNDQITTGGGNDLLLGEGGADTLGGGGRTRYARRWRRRRHSVWYGR